MLKRLRCESLLFSNDFQTQRNKINNVILAKEFLETSKSDIWKLLKDTTTINIASEVGQDLSSFVPLANRDNILDPLSRGIKNIMG